METLARRRLTIADGMILVAASALAMADSSLDGWAWIPTWDSAHSQLTWAGLVFTIALLLIRLRRPRAGRDDLWRQPGCVACFSVAVAAAMLAIQLGLAHARNGHLMAKLGRDVVLRLFFPRFLPDVSLQATLLVVASWGVLALGGRWKSEPSWVDRAGRLVGLFWIAQPLVNWFT